MPITSKDLLDHLSDLQLALEDYSFEELTVEEASSVKKSYEHFRNQLEIRLWDSGSTLQIPKQDGSAVIPFQNEGTIAALGHDLRNPIHGIIGFAQVLAEAPLEEPYKSLATSLCRASESMAETIDEICAFSRLKQTGSVPVAIPFSVADILKEIAEYARLNLLEKPVRIVMEIAPDLSQPVMGNPSDVRRILLNLIENACRYTLEGAITVVADTSKSTTGDELRIEISDTGIGIPEVELPHVFKPYYQGKQAMELAAKGSGFGLSIVWQLVKKQGGSIQIDSSESMGSKVSLTLPLWLAQPMNELHTPQGIRKKFPSSDAQVLKGKRILVLENNELNLKVLRSRLQLWDCEVLGVSDFDEAIAYLESEPLDLFLLDLRLQNIKTQKGLRAIRGHRNPYIRNFPILGMSADLSNRSANDLKELGIDELLLKPHTAEALFEKVSGLCLKVNPTLFEKRKPDNKNNSVSQIIDLRYLESKCQGDKDSLNILLRALRNGILEFAGRTKIGLKRHDFTSIAEGAEKLLIALEMIKAQSLIPVVQQILQASLQGNDENRIVRAYSAYLEHYPEVAQALERGM